VIALVWPHIYLHFFLNEMGLVTSCKETKRLMILEAFGNRTDHYLRFLSLLSVLCMGQ
jgi:thiamine pyrophosphokinase